MGWWDLRLSAKLLARLRLSVSFFFQLRLTKKLKINSNNNINIEDRALHSVIVVPLLRYI